MSTKDTSRRIKAAPQETDFAATHADEFAGQGGSYIVENGKRRLVERTRESSEANPVGPGRADEVV